MTSTSIYDPKTIEPRWQKFWRDRRVYQPDLENSKKPYYNLMMFPYPSAEGLHVGNMYAFTGADAHGRFKRMQGYDVFEPIGLDGFGIHSENYAIKVGRHPIEHAKVSEKHFYDQLHMIGNGFAWDQKLETYDPEYYKWTQWLFIKMYKNGLAYRKKAMVNWCPSCKTVLSDEQVEGGVCERCKTPTTRKETEQWFFKITKYADQLLNNLDKINWPKKIKVAQRNWIGKSLGVEIDFPIVNKEEKRIEKIRVFTTAHDTIFGVTFMVLAPEHSLVSVLLNKHTDEFTKDKLDEVKKYVEKSLKKTEQQRKADEKEKTGVSAGFYAVNPLNGEKIPVWIADYVLKEYGTGAVMGVPGHDARDHEFAKKFHLSIKSVIKPKQGAKGSAIQNDGFWDYIEIKTQFSEESVLFDSGFLNGLNSRDAKKLLEQEIENRKVGEVAAHYHLRDWLISRQRYWGPPIPMIHCTQCEWQPVPEDQLPVLLPYVKDFQPIGEGKAPLEKAPKEWLSTTCPNCGGEAERSTEVSDTFLDSSWYFLRYPSVGESQKSKVKSQKNNSGVHSELPWNLEITKKWLPVNAYIGGAEHAVLHLLYARFVWMALKDWKVLQGVQSDEPFPFLFSHGLIIKDGAKMSKSKGNVVNPDEYINRFGADALRMYLMFLGPYDQGGDFRDTGMAGMYRFLERVWRAFQKLGTRVEGQRLKEETSPKLKTIIHRTIQRVTEDFEKFKYNTAIAKCMEFMNAWEAATGKDQQKDVLLSKEDAVNFLKLLAPIAPHIAEELYHQLYENQVNSIHQSPWPQADERLSQAPSVAIPIQVNGKTRAVLSVPSADAHNQEKLVTMAKENARVATYLVGTTNIIFVPGKIINFVVS